mgnify:CR=1 FL=1
MLTIGAQRSGKSYKTNEDVKRYLKTGQSALIYNLGKHTDFKEAEYIELLDIRQHEEYIRETEGSGAQKKWTKYKEFLYFRYEDEVYNIKDFNAMFYGRGAKAHSLTTEAERLFFYSYFKYVSNTILVFDDALPIFNTNLKDWMKTLLTRVNHTGRNHTDINYKSKGSDIVIIFHSLNQVPRSILDCYQDDWIFRTFKYSEKPDFLKIKNFELRKSLKSSFDILHKVSKYSYTDYRNGDTKIFEYKGNNNYKTGLIKIK